DVTRVFLARERTVEPGRTVELLEVLNTGEEPELVVLDRSADLRGGIPPGVDLARLEVRPKILREAPGVVAEPAVALGQIFEQSGKPVGARTDDAVGGGAGELTLLGVGAQPPHLHLPHPVLVE